MNLEEQKVRLIYQDMMISKAKGIKENFNDYLLYLMILEDCKKGISEIEYKKLKNILNEKINNLFIRKRVNNSFKRKIKKEKI